MVPGCQGANRQGARVPTGWVPMGGHPGDEGCQPVGLLRRQVLCDSSPAADLAHTKALTWRSLAPGPCGVFPRSVRSPRPGRVPGGAAKKVFRCDLRRYRILIWKVFLDTEMEIFLRCRNGNFSSIPKWKFFFDADASLQCRSLELGSCHRTERFDLGCLYRRCDIFQAKMAPCSESLQVTYPVAVRVEAGGARALQPNDCTCNVSLRSRAPGTPQPMAGWTAVDGSQVAP
jgi:hypothetical protein